MKKLNKVFRTKEIALIDQYTIEHEPINSADLMERAARIWTEYFLKMWPEVSSVKIVAGNGNNGGDGYVIARLLSLQGIQVLVYRVLGSGRMSSDCEINYHRWQAMGEVQEVNEVSQLEFQEGDMIIDAIFGSGLNRKITGLSGEIIRKINTSDQLVIAVDIPSGLAGEDNSWNDPETIVKADYTFTFQFPKLSFFLPENAEYVGLWTVLDIGLHPDGIGQIPACWFYTTEETVRSILPQSPVFAHKGTNGKGLLIAGSEGMMGAAVLAAKAAVHSGVGLLYCHIPVKGRDIMQIAVPEAILDLDRSETCFTAHGKLDEYDAIAVGPALGKGPETVSALKAVLQNWQKTTILDADALNILAEHRELLHLLHDKCILTPHMKEFERLAGKSSNDFERLNKLSTFANQYQVHIVLKGAFSVVATPDAHLYFNMSGNPGMAKGGSGDVLTGVLLALAANRLALLDVLRIGVFAHGLAGDCVVEQVGQRGCCSGLIAEGMGEAWKRLENRNINL